MLCSFQNLGWAGHPVQVLIIHIELVRSDFSSCTTVLHWFNPNFFSKHQMSRLNAIFGGRRELVDLSHRASCAFLHNQHPADCILPILVSAQTRQWGVVRVTIRRNLDWACRNGKSWRRKVWLHAWTQDEGGPSLAGYITFLKSRSVGKATSKRWLHLFGRKQNEQKSWRKLDTLPARITNVGSIASTAADQ